MVYAAATIVASLILPRLEFRYLVGYRHGMTVSVATAVFSSVASGMLALTGIVFSLAFVMVQFSSVAYSPRLVLWFSRDPVISHAMGIFTATFIYSLSALGWVDRDGSGWVPFFSTWVVILLVIDSVMGLAFLVQRLAATTYISSITCRPLRPIKAITPDTWSAERTPLLVVSA